MTTENRSEETAKIRKGPNQKLKMLYLAGILSEETDDRHSLTIQDLIEKLAALGVNADRKTLYRDLEELRRFGMDIITTHTGHYYYYNLGSRDFELPELKLLVDSVQSAKFITNRKSADLIRKLSGLASRHEAKYLQRQVVISGRVKTMNESIYYNVDKLISGMSGKSRSCARTAPGTQSARGRFYGTMRIIILSPTMPKMTRSSTIGWTRCSRSP